MVQFAVISLGAITRHLKRKAQWRFTKSVTTSLLSVMLEIYLHPSVLASLALPLGEIGGNRVLVGYRGGPMIPSWFFLVGSVTLDFHPFEVF